jgi:hypothetical protein
MVLNAANMKNRSLQNASISSHWLRVTDQYQSPAAAWRTTGAIPGEC